ncbi:HNH endonuclease signature motif containing protein, partial [Actinomycetospora sp. OC33-EN08]
VRAALAAARERDPDEHPARSTAEADHRFPGAELTRWIHARDRTCRFPMCTRPAVACQIDHTRDHTHGGPTQADNLGALSLGHHLAKHEPDSGWTVHQPQAGTFVWRS